MKNIILVLGCFLSLTACNQTVNYSIDYEGVDSSLTLQIAVDDLEKSVKEKSSEIGKVGMKDIHFTLNCDKQLKDGDFGYKVKHDGKGGEIEFSGSDAISITHAVYTFLEKLGYTYDITGVSVPVKINADALLTSEEMIHPSVRWRGIRQHVNFPMDISSYPIEEAKEYIDHLVRMRFNKLTIHSYPGQWYETMYGDNPALAGHYFYGNKHIMYNNKFLQEKVTRNDSLYCIPAAEVLKNKSVQNSKFAVDWMQQLIRYAKARGLYIQFSFEPRVDGVEQAVRTAHDIQKTYPEINALELITEETGGWGSGCTRRQVEATLKEYFTKEIASDSLVQSPIKPKQSDLNSLYKQIGIISKAVHELDKEWKNKPELKLGIYSTMTQYTTGAYRLARLALPNNHICLMSSHGSEGTSKAIPQVIRTAEDMQHTEIYSWVEFDGLMYLSQNSIHGNEVLNQDLRKINPSQQNSVLFNHWRTAENRTSARYAAEVTLNSSVTAAQFYTEYASRMDIAQSAKYQKAFELINEADVYSTYHLGNIGFCWMGAWRSGGSFTWMKKENIEHAHNLYMKAGNLIGEILKETKEKTNAHEYLAFVGNRLVCTLLYLDAFKEAVGIQSIKGGENMPESEKLRACQICDKALLIFEQYMEMHSRMMPDRGCEGTLVSIWNSPIKGLKIYREKLGGISIDQLPEIEGVIDAPPLPFLYE